jgi:hypothetical protein
MWTTKRNPITRLTMQTQEPRMEWEYYTNRSKRRKIDFLLHEAATLFANCDNTMSARIEAKRKEQGILNEIAKYDRHFAESCGWSDPNQPKEDTFA